jgi:hypothetical protein
MVKEASYTGKLLLFDMMIGLHKLFSENKKSCRLAKPIPMLTINLRVLLSPPAQSNS